MVGKEIIGEYMVTATFYSMKLGKWSDLQSVTPEDCWETLTGTRSRCAFHVYYFSLAYARKFFNVAMECYISLRYYLT